MGRRSKYPAEVRERAVRLVFEQRPAHESQWAAIESIADKMGCTAETLRKWVRQAERDGGGRPGLTTTDRERLKDLERENPRAEAGERDSSQGVRVFRTGGARPPTEVMVAFIDEHRERVRGRADLRVLPIAPSTYYEHRARRRSRTAAGASQAR